jgi:maltose phosphorylase
MPTGMILEPLEVKNLRMKLCDRSNKTHFEVTTFMQNSILENGVNVHISPSSIDTTLDKIQFEYDVLVAQGQNHLSKNWGIHRFFKS